MREYQIACEVSSMDILICGLLAVSAGLSVAVIVRTLRNWRK